MIELYAAYGSCSICAHILLEELELPFRATYVTLRDPASPLGKVNPLGKVPTLALADGVVLTQSMVVLPYLADLKPESRWLAQDDQKLRRHTLEWLAFFNSDVHPAMKMLAGAERYCADPDGLRHAFRPVLQGYFNIVENRLRDQLWLTGDEPTIADIYAAAAFGWGIKHNATTAPYTLYKSLAERVEGRPAAKRARAREALYAV